MIKIEVVLNQFRGSAVDVISNKFVNAGDFFHVANRAETGGSEGFEHIDARELFVLGFLLCLEFLGKLIDRHDAEVPVELLDRVVEYGAPILVHFICLAFAAALDFDHVVFVGLELAVNVKDVGLAFGEGTLSGCSDFQRVCRVLGWTGLV